MRAVIQRVKKASVTVAGQQVGAINNGLLVFLGVHRDDGDEQVRWMAQKVINLRVFADGEDKMNLSLKDIQGEILVVSQFTLYGDCRKGRRPGYSTAAPPEMAEKIYLQFVEQVGNSGIATATGTFQAMMDVELLNDGPVTLLLDSDKIF